MNISKNRNSLIKHLFQLIRWLSQTLFEPDAEPAKRASFRCLICNDTMRRRLLARRGPYQFWQMVCVSCQNPDGEIWIEGPVLAITLEQANPPHRTKGQICYRMIKTLISLILALSSFGSILMKLERSSYLLGHSNYSRPAIHDTQPNSERR